MTSNITRFGIIVNIRAFFKARDIIVGDRAIVEDRAIAGGRAIVRAKTTVAGARDYGTLSVILGAKITVLEA